MTYIQIKVPNWVDSIFAWPVMLYRKWKYGYTFRKIYLGEGEFTIVEPPDYYAYGKFKWVLFGTGYNFYAVRDVKIGPKKTKRVYMHREIMRARKGKLVDHQNNTSLDNRRANLRFANPSQNVINRPKKPNTSSKYRGVRWDKSCNLWRAEIYWQHNGRSVSKFLGMFKNEIDAAHTYDKAARKYHKDFARLNFSEDT